MEKNFAQTYKVTSKEFWKNYWFYYKPHTIWGIVIIILIAGSIHSCVTRIDPDVTLMYLGEQPLFTTNDYDVNAILGEYANDVDGDGQCSAALINLTYGGSDPQMSQAATTKFDIEIAEGNPFIAMVDKKIAERYKDADVFICIDDLVSQYNIPEERVLYDGKGNAIAVDVSGTRFGEVVGTSNFPVYAGVKFMPERRADDEKYVSFYNESIEFYNKILAETIILPQE